MKKRGEFSFADAVGGATLIVMNCPRRKTCGEVFGVFYPAKSYKELRVVHASRHEHHAYIKPDGDEIALWKWQDDGSLTANWIPDNCIISVVPIADQEDES